MNFIYFASQLKDRNMPEAIYFEPTADNPKVILDKEKGLFEISGRSLPEDVAKFYAPVMDWVLEYITDPNDETEFVFDLEYFNSSSARLIVKMLVELEKLEKMGKKVKAVWLYKENDDVMQERGEELKSVVLLPFELKAYN